MSGTEPGPTTMRNGLGPVVSPTDRNTGLCCVFVLALFQSTTANKIDSERIPKIIQSYSRYATLKYYKLQQGLSIYMYIMSIFNIVSFESSASTTYFQYYIHLPYASYQSVFTGSEVVCSSIIVN